MGRQVESFQPLSPFPFFITHFTDSMSIGSIGKIWSADLWNPKYALHVYKVPLICWAHYMDLPLGPRDIS